MAQCGKEDKGQYSWIQIRQVLRVFSSLCLSHTYAKFDPFREIKRMSYIFIKKCVMAMPLHHSSYHTSLVLWHINLCRLSNDKSIFIQIVQF